MLNTNYASEKAMATKFIQEHSNDIELRIFLDEMQNETPGWMHSDRWSKIYDWMEKHYPEATGSLITGLTYYCED